MNLEEENERLKELVRCLLENDPNDIIADGGVTVFDQWAKDAQRVLNIPTWDGRPAIDPHIDGWHFLILKGRDKTSEKDLIPFYWRKDADGNFFWQQQHGSNSIEFILKYYDYVDRIITDSFLLRICDEYTQMKENELNTYHPEFGSYWREGGGGYNLLKQAKSVAWAEGYRAASSITINPHYTPNPTRPTIDNTVFTVSTKEVVNINSNDIDLQHEKR